MSSSRGPSVLARSAALAFAPAASTHSTVSQVPINSKLQHSSHLISMQLVRLFLVSIASTAVFVSAEPAASNASSPSVLLSTNSSHELGPSSGGMCDRPRNAVGKWWYNYRSDGPYACYGDSWAMLNSYRSGGIENVHWKYTENPHDSECLTNWTYYAADGMQIIARTSGRITREQATWGWCALPVYRSGGQEYHQWAYCACSDFDR